MALLIKFTLLFFCIIFPDYSNELVNYELENGLKIILYKDVSKPTVSIKMFYRVGSSYEKRNRTGFAHFLEHLMFEGSKNIKKGDYFLLSQKAGGELNAYTHFDMTVYEHHLPSSALPLGIWMESERMLHPRITENGMEAQRKIVKEERKERLDNQPYGRLGEKFNSMIFENSNYEWMPAGEFQYIDKAKLNEFIDFKNKYYIPNNAILVISGNLDIQETKNLIQNYFSEIKKGKEITKHNKFCGEILKDEIVSVEERVELPAVKIGFRSYPISDKKRHILEFLETILSDGESSRLVKKLREEKRLVAGIDAGFMGLKNCGAFIITAYAKSPDTDPGKIREEIFNTLNEISTNPISKIEIERARNKILTREREIFYSTDSLAENFGKFEFYFQNPKLAFHEEEKIKKITEAEITEELKSILSKKSKTVYCVKQK